MGAFQILDKEGIAIPINILDREVCELWGVEYSKERYAVPKKREDFSDDREGAFEYVTQSNWFDTIGWQISQGMSFEDIIKEYTSLFEDYLGKKDEEGVTITLEYLYPKRMLVLNTWIKKGYQPIKIDH